MISEKLYIEYKIIHSLGELAKILIGEYVYTQWGEIKTLRTTPDGVSRHHNPLVVQGKTRKIVMATGTPVPVRHFLIPPTATGDYNTPTPYGDGNPYGSRGGSKTGCSVPQPLMVTGTLMGVGMEPVFRAYHKGGGYFFY